MKRNKPNALILSKIICQHLNPRTHASYRLKGSITNISDKNTN